MKLERRRGYWLVDGGPVPPGATAITIGPVVFARRGAMASPRLERHEREHVRQWREHGPLRFLVRYLGAYARWRLRGYPHVGAYRRISFEVEAEWVARRPELVEGASTSVGSRRPGRRLLTVGRVEGSASRS